MFEKKGKLIRRGKTKGETLKNIPRGKGGGRTLSIF